MTYMIQVTKAPTMCTYTAKVFRNGKLLTQVKELTKSTAVKSAVKQTRMARKCGGCK